MKKRAFIAAAALFGIVAVFIAYSGGADETVHTSMSASIENGIAVSPPGIDGEYVKPSETDLKKILTPLQYDVTQRDGTEAPFDNVYWNNYEDGIYVDIVSGEPLFSSRDMFDSGTGWPSFTKPLEPGNVVAVRDVKFGMVRIEVRSFFADSHLGHVFDDGPAPTGLRYCMNSASLRFIPVADMEREGYGSYLKLFE